MTLRETETVDLATPTGAMRTHIFLPKEERRYPGVLFYSEIFQVTAPIRRTAALIAGHGYIVAVPEIYHEFEVPGTALAYDQAGVDRGNALKKEKELHALDGDSQAVVEYLQAHPACTGKLGAAGICIGGHLSFRAAAKHREILACACFYGTDLHTATLSKSGDDTLAQAEAIKAEMLMVWGRQDPHVPAEGRQKIHDVLREKKVNFTWHEFNGAHAFLRDEGPRYDPELALHCYDLLLELFHRKLTP
jgi:carboxymethylenebutenolidase